MRTWLYEQLRKTSGCPHKWVRFDQLSEEFHEFVSTDIPSFTVFCGQCGKTVDLKRKDFEVCNTSRD